MVDEPQVPQADEPVAPAVPQEPDAPTDAPEEKTEENPEPPKTEEDAQEAINDSDKTEESSGESEEKPEEPKVDESTQTRQEKRAERTDATGTRFIDRVKRETTPSAPLPEAKPHQPLDFSQGDKYIDPDGNVKTDVLEQDRQAAVEAAKIEASRETAQTERERAAQTKFFDDVNMESKILVANPKYDFLKDNENERAQHINEQFALAVGYQVQPMFDPQTGQPLLDPSTGKQAVREVVSNPNISYQKFVQELVDREDKMVEARLAEKNGNLESMQAKSGIKPGGGSAKTKTPSLDEIKDLSDDEWEKARPSVLSAHGVKPN